MKNKTALVLSAYFVPGFKAGGPIRSIQNLFEALGEEFKFRLVTSDRDLKDKKAYPGVVPYRWVQFGKAEVRYQSPGLRGFLDTCAQVISADRNTVLYLNSYFARRYSMLPIFLRRFGLCGARVVVLAPRGEFSVGALRLKPKRKHLYVTLTRLLGFYKGIVWHASSEFEAADIQRVFPGLSSNIEVAGIIPEQHRSDNHRKAGGTVLTAPDLPTRSQQSTQSRRKEKGELHTVFVGRISRMKNLHGALKLLRPVFGQVVFDIYGAAEDKEYWKECQNIIATLPSNIQVQYRGQIAHERVTQIFNEHDLLLLPTFGENYGHVIYEALISGCPVLISDQTPWRDLEKYGAGWDIPLEDEERFRTVLQQCVDADAEWFAARSAGAVRYASAKISSWDPIDSNRKMLQFAFRIAGKARA